MNQKPRKLITMLNILHPLKLIKKKEVDGNLSIKGLSGYVKKNEEKRG